MNRRLFLAALLSLALMFAGFVAGPAQRVQANPAAPTITFDACTRTVTVSFVGGIDTATMLFGAESKPYTVFFIKDSEEDYLLVEERNVEDGQTATFSYTFPPDATLPTEMVITIYVFAEVEVSSTRVPLNSTCPQTTVQGVDNCPLPTNGAVVGKLIRETFVYWGPDISKASTVRLTTAPDAKTYWVIGIDPTRKFFKIIIACGTYWVPVETMSTNPDKVWNNTPLPKNTTN